MGLDLIYNSQYCMIYDIIDDITDSISSQQIKGGKDDS